MKYLTALSVTAMLALAAPAGAQIVNGAPGTSNAPAPIGAKAGGSAATIDAPGQAAAVQGAEDNAHKDATMQTSNAPRRHRRHAADDAAADSTTH